jgi:signal transduction histidine kinase
MDDRTLEARLTARILLVAGAVLAFVSLASLVVTDRVLDASDSSSARAIVWEARELFQRELDEGDSVKTALEEVVDGVRGVQTAERVRVTARSPDAPPMTSGELLPPVAGDACATLFDGKQQPWRACETSLDGVSLVAAIPISAHRRALWTLAQAALVVAALAMLALRFAMKRAVRGAVGELAALVDWTGRILEVQEPLSPPRASTREVTQLGGAFDALVRRLLDVLSRERASSAHIAHELRTPLTAMSAELERLALRDPAVREAVRGIRADIARFADVIDAILVLSSSSKGRRSDVVVNVADLARAQAPPGVPVDAPEEALIEADEPLVTLALRNLIDNARRHAGGATRIVVSRETDSVRLSVIDEGPGVSEVARPRMFDRYWRGSADGDGRGLGLALVKAVAERHGGTARAEPGPAGKGLCLSMTMRNVLGWH